MRTPIPPMPPVYFRDGRKNRRKHNGNLAVTVVKGRKHPLSGDRLRESAADSARSNIPPCFFMENSKFMFYET